MEPKLALVFKNIYKGLHCLLSKVYLEMFISSTSVSVGIFCSKDNHSVKVDLKEQTHAFCLKANSYCFN